MWAWINNSGHRPLILKPYTRPGPGLMIQGGLLLAFMFFCLVFGFFYALTTPFLIRQLAIPIVILALIAIWALPDMKSSPAGYLDWMTFAFLVVLFVWPNYLAIALPGMPWITLMRVIGIPLVIVLAISFSVSAEFRTRMREVLSATPMVFKLLVAFIAIMFVSIAFSENVDFSIQRFINSQLTWTAIFFASCYVFVRPGRVEKWAYFLWAIAALLCAIGVVEYRMNRPPWGAYVPSFLRVEDEMVARVLTGSVRSATGQYRVQSTFTTSLGLAEFLALTAPFVIHIAMVARRLWVKVAAAATLPLMFYTVIVTDSRLGAVGFLLSFMLYLLLWGGQRWRANPRSLLAPAIVLAYPVIFTLFITATFFVGRLRNMVWGSGDSAASTASRVTQYKTGIPMILEQPWGYGVGMGGSTLGFVNPAGTVTIDTYYLMVGLEYGVIGFFVYYGMVAVSCYQAGKYALNSPSGEFSFFAPLAISLANFIVIKSVFSQQDNHPLIFMMLGIVTALVFRMMSPEKAAAWHPAPAKKT